MDETSFQVFRPRTLCMMIEDAVRSKEMALATRLTWALRVMVGDRGAAELLESFTEDVRAADVWGVPVAADEATRLRRTIVDVKRVSVVRDGGSWLMTYVAGDGQEYYLFVKADMHAPGPVLRYHAPVIEDRKEVIDRLTFEEAQVMIAGVELAGSRFPEMAGVINSGGYYHGTGGA